MENMRIKWEWIPITFIPVLFDVVAVTSVGSICTNVTRTMERGTVMLHGII